MSLFRIILKSLRHHALSSMLAVFSIAAGAGLLVSVVSLREQAHDNFTQVGLGVDAVLGPKGSPLQVVLNSLYHLETMPGTVKWPYFKKVVEQPIVEDGFPFITGHSYAGYRVNAVEIRFLTEFEYLPDKRFSFEEKEGGWGRPVATATEAVAGWAAAQALGVKPGSTFNPVCGVKEGDPVHTDEVIEFVGVLAPTGTPHDRAIYISLEGFYGLSGHASKVDTMALHEDFREISGAYLKIRRIRGGAVHPGIQDLQYQINQSKQAQFVVPNEVLPRLFDIIGWVDRVLMAVAGLVTIMAGLFLFTALVSALRERKRDIALMRSLGATRRTVFGLVLSESLLLTLAGGVLGLILGHAIVFFGAHFIRVETGMVFTWSYLSSADLFLLPGMLLIGLIAGILPSLQAYRLGVLTNLAGVP